MKYSYSISIMYCIEVTKFRGGDPASSWAKLPSLQQNMGIILQGDYCNNSTLRLLRICKQMVLLPWIIQYPFNRS